MKAAGMEIRYHIGFAWNIGCRKPNTSFDRPLPNLLCNLVAFGRVGTTHFVDVGNRGQIVQLQLDVYTPASAAKCSKAKCAAVNSRTLICISASVTCQGVPTVEIESVALQTSIRVNDSSKRGRMEKLL